MSADRRHKNADWYTADVRGEVLGEVRQGAVLATLMDIRDELRRMNVILHCPNFLEIPTILRTIRRNTAKPRKTRKAAKK